VVQALNYSLTNAIASSATSSAVLVAALFFPGAIMLAMAVWLGRWSAGTWQATSTPTVARRLGAVACVAGGAIALIGYLQPWWVSMDTSISEPCVRRSTLAWWSSSCSVHTGADLALLRGVATLGWLLFALLLLMPLVSLPSLWQPTRARALWLAGLVVALSIIGYALSLIITISPTLYGPLAPQMRLVSLDAGLWLTLGGLLGALAGAGAIALSPRAEPQPRA
jgi:hypothetical protein